MMVYQSPSGARDLLPLDVAQKIWIEKRLQEVFHRWSYHRIITSTLERLDTLMAGGAIERSTVIQFQDAEDEVLGLRPEITASIARTAVTRMVDEPYPQRLYYNANIFRRSRTSSEGSQHEFYQAGVELLGADGIVADGEILLLLLDCLQNLQLNQWYLILGEADLTRSLLSAFPVSLQGKIRRAIANLDRVTIETLPLAPEQREKALFLFELRGKPADVLQRVSSLDLDANQQEIVNNLKSLVDLLTDSLPSPLPIILDLSLLQTFDYYTGIVFEIVSSNDTGAYILGRGGRYDRLLELYHPKNQQISGIGFAFNIEDLHNVLQHTNLLPAEIPASQWLVVPVNSQAYSAAFSYAQKLRESPDIMPVEINLFPEKNPAEVREYARQKGIAKIAWVKEKSEVEIEEVSGS